MNGRKKPRKILLTWIYAKQIQTAGTQEMSEIGSVQDVAQFDGPKNRSVAQFDGPKNRSGACDSIHGSKLKKFIDGQVIAGLQLSWKF